MTYEQIIEQLQRIVHGDNYNDLESLVGTLQALSNEAKIALKKQSHDIH